MQAVLFVFFHKLQVIAFHESRVTTVMAVGQELWVGLGNGQVLIFDVINNDAYEAEAYVVLKEQEGKVMLFLLLSVSSRNTVIAKAENLQALLCKTNSA